MVKPNFQKPSSSWRLTSVSSCPGRPFRWGSRPASRHRSLPHFLSPPPVPWLFFFSILQFILRTTSWSSGRCSTSSCPAFWERSASLPPATENPSWPVAMPKALHESRRQVCEHRALPLLLRRWVCWDLLMEPSCPIVQVCWRWRPCIGRSSRSFSGGWRRTSCRIFLPKSFRTITAPWVLCR